MTDLKDYEAIFYQLFHLGLMEAALNFSIISNSNITISKPCVTFVDVEEVANYLKLVGNKILLTIIDYELDTPERQKGFMMFYFSDANKNADMFLKRLNLGDLPTSVKSDNLSFLIENTNILGNSVLKTLDNKTNIKIHSGSPEIVCLSMAELVKHLGVISEQYKIDMSKSMIVESTFIEEEKHINEKLILLAFPGDSFDVLINKLMQSRENW